MKHVVAIAVVCALLTGIVGCSLRKPPSGENYYAQATEEYSQHFYHPAIDDYQKLIDQYPFSPYAEEAELKIGLSYYNMHDYAEAIGSLGDFQRMHPTSKKIALASYYLAMANFAQVGRPDQDQTHTELALKEFEALERRFPESDFAALSKEQIEICHEVLARHEYLVGDFYYKRANFKASESRMAELLAVYPDTPIAPEALYQLGLTLEKQGKKYSAAQAFAALKDHYPKTPYGRYADAELKRLNQPVGTEEDPLKLVLAESGFNPDQADQDQSEVSVHENLADLAVANPGATQYGSDGLPLLDQTGRKPKIVQKNPGAATLRTVRLSSSNPPMSVIFDLSGPANYDQHLQNGDGHSTLTVFLKGVTASSSVQHHLVFDRSIFRDCNIEQQPGGTKVTVNTTPVERFAIVPLEDPARLLVTFTPQGGPAGMTANIGNSPVPGM
ncbi:MAG: outer membrane protein assembly factor BamD [Candidatus Binataceae bacterium]